MELKIAKWGNGVGILLPSSVTKSWRVKPGDMLQADIADQRMVLTPKARKYTLDELLSQCDEKAPMSKELQEWLDAPAVGNEII